jgi:hypothetical protein
LNQSALGHSRPSERRRQAPQIRRERIGVSGERLSGGRWNASFAPSRSKLFGSIRAELFNDRVAHCDVVIADSDVAV